jgi:hypothetical protein
VCPLVKVHYQLPGKAIASIVIEAEIRYPVSGAGRFVRISNASIHATSCIGTALSQFLTADLSAADMSLSCRFGTVKEPFSGGFLWPRPASE